MLTLVDLYLMTTLIQNETHRIMGLVEKERDDLYRAQLFERRKRLLIIEAKLNRMIDNFADE